MSNYGRHFSKLPAPQSMAAERTQVPSSAGGFTFAVDLGARLDRVVILGSDGGTYYATEKAITVENARSVLACIETDGARAVRDVEHFRRWGRGFRRAVALRRQHDRDELHHRRPRRRRNARRPRVLGGDAGGDGVLRSCVTQ